VKAKKCLSPQNKTDIFLDNKQIINVLNFIRHPQKSFSTAKKISVSRQKSLSLPKITNYQK